MNKTTMLIIVGLIVLVAAVYFVVTSSSSETELASGNQSAQVTAPTTKAASATAFTSVTSQELEAMLEKKDFTLIDVHIPEQKHIPGTDYMISYNDVDQIESVIPSKDSKVLLYCRSGNMSKQTASELVKRGYTNIIELDDGLNGWAAEGREVLPLGSIKSS